MLMRAFLGPLFAVSVTLGTERAGATPPTPERDRYSLSVHGETHAELFQQALLPGAYGAIVADQSALPVYQFVLLRARDLNIDKNQSGFDLEAAAWWRAELGAAAGEPPLDGDVQTANIGYHHGPLTLRFGRQHVAGGAARYARFDGLALDADLGSGFVATAYGGLTVLPRWNARRTFTYLGAAADSNLKDPTFSADSRARTDYSLGGARLGWAGQRVHAGISFHEQHESGGLTRRTLALDETTQLSSALSAGASASAELEAERIAEARVWIDAAASTDLDLSLEWLHTEPALFLSRQSVLSVFSADAYEEGGARAQERASGRITLEGGAWLELYTGSRPGARAEIALRTLVDRAGATFVRVAYARVLTPDNGYHSLRCSLTRRILAQLSGTLEAYAYLYDQAIRTYRTSTVYSETLEYRPTAAVGLLWGASVVRSPYTSLDVQTELRLAYDFDFATLRGAR
ncbi:MAG: hypothetical protein ABI627_06105 [Polyangiaceae bacterium]